MLDRIIDIDKSLFVFLNGLGSASFDGFWLFITEKIAWIPLFLYLAYLIFKKLGWRQALFLVLFLTFLITFTDQTANFFKHSFQRPRPCSDPELKTFIRIVCERNSFSFFSAHAATSLAVSTFLYLSFRKEFRYLAFLFLWPLIFGYSRIYLGLHFPFDVLTGYFIGCVYGILTYIFYQKASSKYFPSDY